jgi:hypothetical protein
MRLLLYLAALVILGGSSWGISHNLPGGELAALMDAKAVQQAMGTKQMNLLSLVFWSFGAGAGANCLLTGAGGALGLREWPGRIVVGTSAVLLLGGLVVGVLSKRLTGILVPMFMNPGTGLVVGSLVGLVVGQRGIPQREP